ncbi:8-oxoguanine deaminase, partial [Brachyspira hampsonii]|nr:8-oxoguanine deaminase [Brachyspira hampsonii]
MSSLFIKNASSIVTCDNNDTVHNSSNLFIENGVITYIGKETKEEKNADKV